jgi:nitrogen fixation/metabolism regulation signal transduction histidine kinase
MSLRVKLTILLLALVAVVTALSVWATHALHNEWLAWLLVVGAAVLPTLWLAARVMRPISQLLRALEGTVVSYREGDFNLSLVADRNDELGDLMKAHNELSAALRTQRAHLVQRELLLDTVMQNSPVALVLVDEHERVAYANIAARQLLSEGRSINGLRFSDALTRAPRHCARRPRHRGTIYSRRK